MFKKNHLSTLLLTVTCLTNASPLQWEKVGSLNTEKQIHSICWSGENFVAVGEDGATVISPDGKEWETIENPMSEDLRSVVSNGEITVAVGGESSFGTGSQDGQTFNSSKIVYSQDHGETWDSTVALSESPVNSISWNGSVFIATASGLSGYMGYKENSIAQSSDGINWSITHELSDDTPPNKVLWTGDRFLVSTIYGNRMILSSTTGEQWDTVYTAPYSDLKTTLFQVKNKLYYKCGNEIITSLDGGDWEPYTEVDSVVDNYKTSCPLDDFELVSLGESNTLIDGSVEKTSKGVALSYEQGPWEFYSDSLSTELFSHSERTILSLSSDKDIWVARIPEETALQSHIPTSHSPISLIASQNRLQFSAPIESVSIYSAQGKELLRQGVDRSKEVTLKNPLSKGVYFVKARGGDVSLSTHKIVIK